MHRKKKKKKRETKTIPSVRRMVFRYGRNKNNRYRIIKATTVGIRKYLRKRTFMSRNDSVNNSRANRTPFVGFVNSHEKKNAKLV